MRILSLLAVSLVAVSCGGDDEATSDARPPADASIDTDASGPDSGTALIPEDLPTPLPSGAVNLTAVTYNAGLIGVVLGAAERLPRIQTAVKALSADVVCLQEIYTGFTKPNLFAAAMADTYPYAYWTWTGVAASGNGLMILSQHPLYRGREIQYSQGTTTTVNRMAIGATLVDASEGWHVNVLCTHLHAGLGPVDDIPIKVSEITELETWAASEWPDGPTLLLGDFNCGPTLPEPNTCECDTDGGCDDLCDAPDLTSYNKLLETWTDVFPVNADFFTSGHDQFIEMSLVPGLYPDEPSQRIDHCLYRDFSGAELIAGELVLEEPQSIPAGDVTLEYLSDHYGVMCDFIANCGSDSAIEPNDTLINATITPIPATADNYALVGLEVCPASDVDLFELGTDVAGVDITATLTYLSNNGALTLEILDSSGTPVAAGSVGATSSVLSATATAVAAGTYYVSVKASAAGIKNRYDMAIVTVVP